MSRKDEKSKEELSLKSDNKSDWAMQNFLEWGQTPEKVRAEEGS